MACLGRRVPRRLCSGTVIASEAGLIQATSRARCRSIQGQVRITSKHQISENAAHPEMLDCDFDGESVEEDSDADEEYELLLAEINKRGYGFGLRGTSTQIPDTIFNILLTTGMIQFRSFQDIWILRLCARDLHAEWKLCTLKAEDCIASCRTFLN